MASQTRLPCDLAPRRLAPLAALAALLLVAGSLGATSLALAATPYQPPSLTNPAVQDATLALSLKYANVVPGLDAKTLRWFLYSIEHRESTFSTTLCNYNDGAGSWNKPLASFWPTSDHLPHGCGLTQLTGWTHEGMAYPGNSATAPTLLGKGIYGTVAPPAPVSSLSNPFDAKQNVERFLTEEVLPDYVVIHKAYPSFTTDQVLRAVAFHWNKGEYTKYDPNNCDYLCLYDKYVATYKPAVLADAAWPPTSGTTPTPAPAPTPAPSTGTTATTFTLSPHVNAWWIEVYVSGAPTAVSVSVNGGAPRALTHEGWGSWATSAYAPAGSSVTFTATVGGVAVKSPTYKWLSASAPAPATTTATFTLGPNVNAWWVEAYVSGSPSAVSVSVNGGAPVALSHTSWGSWAKSLHVNAGDRVVLTATVGTATATSPTFTWP